MRERDRAEPALQDVLTRDDGLGMAKRRGLWTSREFALAVVSDVVVFCGLIIGLIGHPLLGGPMAFVGAVGMTASGLRARRRLKQHRA